MNVEEHPADDLLGLTEALVAIPSVHPDESAIADAVERRLRRSAALTVDRVRNNVVARTHLGRDRRVVLGGHLDTVPPAGNERPRRDGEVLWGLGSADMKGSVAVLLALAGAVGEDANHDLTFILYEGEEVAEAHNGLRVLFAEKPDLVACDLAVLMEPTGGCVEAGCQGTIHLRATVHGARAHTARPWTGRNAVHAAVPILDRLAAFEAETVEVDGLEYRESLQVVALQAGVRPNVVPDECHITVNRRFAPSRTLDEALAETTALLDGADAIEMLNESVAAPPNLSHPLVAEFVKSLDVPVRPKLGWTDVARFAAAGIPALNFGAGDPEVAHTADECVEGSELRRVRDALGAFLGVAG